MALLWWFSFAAWRNPELLVRLELHFFQKDAGYRVYSKDLYKQAQGEKKKVDISLKM